MKKHKVKIKWLLTITVLLSLTLGIYIGYGLKDYSYNELGYAELSAYQHSRYNLTEYNCLNMSYEWEEIFESIGLNTILMFGNNSIGAGHCWVKVYFPNGNSYEFESTTLKFEMVSLNWETTYEDEGIYR